MTRPASLISCLFALALLGAPAASAVDHWVQIQNGVVTGIFSGPQPFATTQVADTVHLGDELVNGVWVKSAAQTAKEADTTDRLTKRANLSPATIATLRTWADDAEATTATSGNAVAVLNTVLDRLAVFFDRFADLLEAQRLDQ